MGWIGILLAGVTLGLAGRMASRNIFRQPSGWPRSLAAAVLAWAWFTLGLQILGSVGLLNLGAILAWSCGGLAIGWGAGLVTSSREDSTKPIGDGWGLAGTVALRLTILAVAVVGTPPLLIPPKVVSDGPIYHLFFAAKWWKAGRIFLIASPFGENAATYFPANGDLFFSGLMALYGGDRPARIGQAPFLLLAGMTTFALAKRLGVSASSAIIATAWFLTSYAFLLFSFEANVDTIFVAGYLAAVYFGVRYAIDDGGCPALVLAGLSAGLAWGTKATATVFVPPLLVLGGLMVVRRPISWKQRLVQLAAMTVATLLPCGFWFGRSMILTGNPLYPLHVEAMGHVVLRGWYPRSAMVWSQFYLPVGDWRSLISVVLTVFEPRMMPFWVAAIAGAWSWGRAKGPFDRWVCFLGALAVVNVASYWLLIPYRTQQRFMVQAMALAAVPLGRLLDRAGWLGWLAVGVLAAHLTTAQSWPFGRAGERAPWELSAKIPTVTAAPLVLPPPWAWSAMWNDPAGMAYLLTLGGIALGSLVTALAWQFASRAPSTKRRAIAAGITVVVAFGYAGAMESLYDGPSRRTFPAFADYQRAWAALEGISPKEGTRIAYAGTNLPYFLMAGGLRNDVFYVNIDAHPDWLMHDYHLSAAERGDPPLWNGDRPGWGGPRPGWDRIHPDYHAWLQNLKSKRIHLLVVARANPDDGLFNLADSEHFPIERVWADEHPESFLLVYPREQNDPLMRIYRVIAEEKEKSATDRPRRPH